MAVKKVVDNGNIDIKNVINDPLLPQKSLFRPDEVAAYFNVSRSVVYLWIDHGILMAEKIGGTIRIPRSAILACRFNNQIRAL